MLSLAPQAIYVAHYGQVRDVPRFGADMHRLIIELNAQRLKVWLESERGLRAP